TSALYSGVNVLFGRLGLIQTPPRGSSPLSLVSVDPGQAHRVRSNLNQTLCSFVPLRPPVSASLQPSPSACRPSPVSNRLLPFPPMPPPGPSPLREVLLYFTRLGFIAFGGPAAHIAIMRRDLVQQRKWTNDQDFVDMLGVTNLIPGPNSTELTM